MSPLQWLNTFPLKVPDVRDPSGFEKQTMEMEIGKLGSKAQMVSICSKKTSIDADT